MQNASDNYREERGCLLHTVLDDPAELYKCFLGLNIQRQGGKEDRPQPLHNIQLLTRKKHYGRRKHDTPELTLSRDLCNSAQEWADHLVAINTMQHSNTSNGENLYYTWSSAPNTLTGKEAVDNWYSEIKDYNFSKPGFASNTGHFTQVVWKESTEVGVGVGLGINGKTVFVVGQYNPAGNMNMEGYFMDNVLPEV